MNKSKPHVAAACFCEHVLIEPDNVLTAVRIVDVYNLNMPKEPLPDGALPAVEIKGVICLKSGDVTGKHVLSLVLQNPLGTRTEVSPDGGWPVVFNGGNHGVNLRLQFPLGVKNLGLCWFDVMFDGEVLTRMPLMLQAAGEQPAVATVTR